MTSRRLFGCWLGVSVVLGLLAALPGCDSAGYNLALVYPLRDDPIPKEDRISTAERYDPERPGVLPVLSYQELQQPSFLLHPYSDKFLNPAKLSDKQLVGAH